MQDLSEYKPKTHNNSLAAVIIVLAAAMIGASMGLLLADRDALSLLKGVTTGQAPGQASGQIRTPRANAELEFPASRTPEDEGSQAWPASKVIPTGLSSISAIHYASQSNSIRLTFDMADADLIQTGKLSSPDRIYVDLRDKKQGAAERVNAQKTLNIDSKLVTRVRITQRESGSIRIVLDLKRSCNFTYKIPPGSSSGLIVELRPRATGSSASKVSGKRMSDRNRRWTLYQYPSR